jgi:hypothetical protein
MLAWPSNGRVEAENSAQNNFNFIPPDNIYHCILHKSQYLNTLVETEPSNLRVIPETFVTH